MNDSNKLKNNLNNYVEGVVKAIAEYTGYPYSPPKEEALDSYTVKKNDTLYSISRRFNIPIEQIKRINKLISDNLSIGQVLLLSEPTINNDDYTIYIVKKGDTLYSISRENNTTIEEIKSINKINNNLSIGQEILIPINNATEDLKENIEEDYSIYTVVSGDSLWKIAKKYNIPVTELIEINNLSNLTLKIGQQLLVPNNEEVEAIDTYIVKKGDTLWSVAKAYNLDVNTLKSLNNLDNNLLSIGQILKIK